MPDATATEVDVLTKGFDANECWVIVFEIKNRDKKHLPTMAEAQLFVAKTDGSIKLCSKFVESINPLY